MYSAVMKSSLAHRMTGKQESISIIFTKLELVFLSPFEYLICLSYPCFH